MNDLVRRCAVAGAAGVCLLAGCKNPLTSHPDDYGQALPLRRLRDIETLSIEQYARQSDVAEESEDLLDEPPPDRLADLERLDLPLDQVRAWTLRNNLDVRVALIDPAIAQRRITEEEAAFESVLFGNVSRFDSLQPTSSTLESSALQSTQFEVGARIPLRTGGEITLSAPFNTTDTNNEFTFLNPSFDVDTTVSFFQPLLRNAGRQANTHQIRVASYQSGIEQARAKLEIIAQLANVDRTYWILYASWRALDVAKQQYALAQAQLEQARRLFEAGRVAEIEVIRAEEGVASRVEDIIIAENDILDAQRELKRLMNVEGLDVGTMTTIIPTTPPEPRAYELEADRLVDLAIANRMELLELELQLAIDASTIDLRQNQTLPLLNLNYTYNLNGLGASFSEALGQIRENDFNDWRVQLSGEIPIGNDAAESRLQQAMLTRVQRLATRQVRVQTISQETLQSIDSITSGWQRILAASQSVRSAARTVEAERRRFEVGRSTSTDVLDAATRLAEAQIAEIRAITEYEISRVDLAFATGTLLGASRVSWEPIDPLEDLEEQEGPTGEMTELEQFETTRMTPSSPVDERTWRRGADGVEMVIGGLTPGAND